MPPQSPTDTHVRDLLDGLNATDEHSTVEAKRSSELGKSILETICAFSNEPGLGGGEILCGVSKPADTLFGEYSVEGVPNVDKLQTDIASQCANVFNHVVRPRMTIALVEKKSVLLVAVDELAPSRKPLFFSKTGLPRGAWRRIGSSDQRCTDDDVRQFHEAARAPTPELDPVVGTTLRDVDPKALQLYRKLRKKVNPQASELDEEDHDLLRSLSCLTDDGRLTLAGLALFGRSRVLRRELPAFRLDYIRVPGNEWIGSADDRFTTLDMRSPILLLVNRAVDAVEADLPKQFHLEEGEIQARYQGLPNRALREVIVNALMHQSFRANQPIQVVRYHNRIEVLNGGHSLKPETELGQKGSKLRNPASAAVLHDLNIAENKGSGIATVRKLMHRADFAPPTFTSNRAADTFNATLSLQHFWDEDTLRWVEAFGQYGLNRRQRRALVHLRDHGSINNERYREINDVDSLKASADLRSLRDVGLVEMKGGGAQTYYQGSTLLLTPLDKVAKQGGTPPNKTLNRGGTPPAKTANRGGTPPAKGGQVMKELAQYDGLPEDLVGALRHLPKRNNDLKAMWLLVQRLCTVRPMSSREIATHLGRKEKYIRDQILPNVRAAGLIRYLYPEEPHRADQAYVAVDIEPKS